MAVKIPDDWVYTGSPNDYTSTTTVSDKPMGKVIGKPCRGEPDVRFDEGAKGNDDIYLGIWPDA